MPQSPEPVYPPIPSGNVVGRDEADTTTDPRRTPSVTGPGFSRKELIKSYANMVARTWVDEEYLASLVADPASALGAAGIPTAPGATIRVIQVKLTGMGQVQDQVDAWIEGNRTGLYDLWLPLKPEDFLDDALDEDVSAERRSCCCCTPCCCCGN